MDQIIQKYNILHVRNKVPELEIRFFDGYGKMTITEENFGKILSEPIIKAGKGKVNKSLTYNLGKNRVEIPFIKNKLGTPMFINKQRIKNMDNTFYRVSLSTEESVSDNDGPLVIRSSNKTKFYRFRERLSKTLKEFPNWRFDFTKVNQVELEELTTIGSILKSLTKGKKDWTYELEVEYVGDVSSLNNVKEISTFKDEISRIVELIGSTMTMSPFLVIKDKLNTPKITDLRSMMNQVRSLNLKDVAIIQNGYAVTEKADGMRMLLYIDANLDIFEIRTTGITPNTSLTIEDESLKMSLIDVEHLETLDRYLLFDLLMIGGEPVVNCTFDIRYEKLNQHFADAFDNDNVLVKMFYFEDVFKSSEKIYNMDYDYYIDGLIYTPINEPYYNNSTYKWKPSKDLTIDLLIRDNQDVIIDKTGTYKIVQLFYMISKGSWIKNFMKTAKDKHLNVIAAKNFGINLKHVPPFFPFPFAPTKEAFYAKIPVTKINVSDYNDDLEKYSLYKDNDFYIAKDVSPMVPIINDMVIEFGYDPNDEKLPWKPYRFRKDKTESYLNGRLQNKFVRGPNGYRAAFENWNLIHKPVTEDMVFGKVPVSSGTKYYKDTKEFREKLAKYMYKFNNHVKRLLYNKYIGEGDSVLEIAAGRGGDIDKALKAGASKIILIDQDGEALKEAERRSVSIKSKLKRRDAELEFMTLDLNKNVLKDIKKTLGAKTKVDVVSCQFAFHYFLRDLKSLKNVFKVIDTFIKPDGYFMITGLDGKTVHQLLSKEDVVSFKKDGKDIAVLTKKYESKRFTKYGQEIDVFIEKIGITHTEFLLNFEMVISFFEKNGYSLVESELFSNKLDTFADIDKLSEAEKTYAGINRFAVFQKKER